MRNKAVFPEIYAIYLPEKDMSSLYRGALNELKDKYFSSFYAVRVRKKTDVSGVPAFVKGKITRKHLKFKLTSRKTELQKTRRAKGGYAVYSRDFSGTLISKAIYKYAHEWEKSIYYVSGSNKDEYAVFENIGSKRIKYIFTDESGEKQEKILYPCRVKTGTAINSYLESVMGKPVLYAKDLAGELCYYDSMEKVTRRKDLYLKLCKSETEEDLVKTLKDVM